MRSPKRCIQTNRRGRKRQTLPSLLKVRAGPVYLSRIVVLGLFHRHNCIALTVRAIILVPSTGPSSRAMRALYLVNLHTLVLFCLLPSYQGVATAVRTIPLISPSSPRPGAMRAPDFVYLIIVVFGCIRSCDDTISATVFASVLVASRGALAMAMGAFSLVNVVGIIVVGFLLGHHARAAAVCTINLVQTDRPSAFAMRTFDFVDLGWVV